jgi:hypothetical protein
MLPCNRVLLAAAWLSPAAASAGFVAPPPAPPLPPPTGTVVTVATVAELESAVASLSSNTTILVQPGTYPLNAQLFVTGVSNVAIRGATDDRNDVVIVGNGMNVPGVPFGIEVGAAQDVLIANLSIGEVQYSPLQLHGEMGCERVHIYNVRVFDAGEQFIKGTVDFGNPNGVDDGILEYSVVEYTVIGPPNGYTNGIDIHFGSGWIIRYNLFRNIRVPPSAPQSLGPAVLMWSGSRDTVTFANTFIDCERAIAYGLGPQAGFTHGHQGGLICSNFIYRSAGVAGDSGISLWDSPGTQVLHNTVVQSGTYPTAIEYRFATTTGVAVENNLADGDVVARDGAQGVEAGNVTDATPGLFVQPSIGDLHLLPTAAAAIDQGVALAECGIDWDGEARPFGPGRDVGADEHVPAVVPSVSVSDAAVTEGDAGTLDAAFTLSLSAATTQVVMVSYATGDLTASAGSDYQATAGTLSFAPGASTGTVLVQVLGDTSVEPDETFRVTLSSPSGATIADAEAVGTIADDDAPSLSNRELVHGWSSRQDIDPQGVDYFRLAQARRSSFEVVAEGLSGSMAPFALERLAADNQTVLQSAPPDGPGTSYSLRFENASGLPVTNQHLRATAACAPSCAMGDAYRLRAFDTTLRSPRFNNSATQVTVLILQNTRTEAVAGTAWFWSTSGTLLGSRTFTLGPRASLAVNTATVPGAAGQSGSVTVSHDGRFGAVAGKAVAVEPATGFTFDSLLAPRPR